VVHKDYRKDKTSVITKYMPIGAPDDSEIRDPKDENMNIEPERGYTLVGKIRAASVEAAKNRITSLRKQNQKLIGLNNQVSAVHGDQDERLNSLDNVFVNNSDPSKVYSMSLYNKTKYYQEMLANQSLSKQNVAKQIKEAEEALKAVPETINEDLASPPAEEELKK